MEWVKERKAKKRERERREKREREEREKRERGRDRKKKRKMAEKLSQKFGGTGVRRLNIGNSFEKKGREFLGKKSINIFLKFNLFITVFKEFNLI